MKKIFMIAIIMMLILNFSAIAFATGDSNIDSGGGDMGQGSSSNSWTSGRDGVRVTIIRESDRLPVLPSIDFSDESNTDIKIHCQNGNKIQYLNGKGLSIKMNGYSSIKPATILPCIINSDGSSNITAIREYFCDQGTIQFIAEKTNINYDLLISGGYKILLEPIAYFKYQGVMYAMTATEAAMFNQSSDNGLRRKIPSLSHQNLPLAMFLEKSDLGLPVWTGGRTGKQSDQNIITYLGMGIVRFHDLEPEPPQESDVIYRTDTEVITSVTLSTGAEKSPDNPAYASFSINGSTYAHSNIYIPEDGSQLAWVKWKTPTEPGIVTIIISSNCNLDKNIIVADIVNLDGNPPYDPQANDRNDSFSKPNC